jgi:membrane-associated protease RseP (regulator of RpoE activity)
MSGWKKILIVVFVAAIATPVAAQDEAARLKAQERALEESAGAMERNIERRVEQDRAIEVQMREAEERLAEAAARVAELSRSRLSQLTRAGRFLRSDHAVLGVTLGSEGSTMPVEGVKIDAVTPGSAAADAGLRAGDVITAVNGESLSADDEEKANRKMLDFMAGVEEGDTLDVEYLRDGRAASVEVRPRSMPYVVGFRSGSGDFAPPDPPGAHAPRTPAFFLFGGSRSWGDMELVSLTEDLGRYFGTDKGLLIVRAPQDKSLKLRDGDVIESIDGRVPSSVSHAMRILGSYQAGETLEIEIMRDKKRQTVSVEMPDNRQSAVGNFRFSFPATVEARSVEIKANGE